MFNIKIMDRGVYIVQINYLLYGCCYICLVCKTGVDQYIISSKVNVGEKSLDWFHDPFGMTGFMTLLA